MIKKGTLARSKTVDSVLDVGKHNVCTGCATCAGICPSEAIEMAIHPSGCYMPQLNQNLCLECHLCMEVCPRLRTYTTGDGKREFILADNLHELTENIFGSSSDDEWLGHCRFFFRGHACDDAIRYNASSGGMVTALLLYALRSGIIDGAIVVKMSADMPLLPSVFIATTENEILEAARSKYCPVPLNLAIREVSRFHGRVALVGLPCHLQGVRRAEECLPWLAQKVVLHIALACFHAVTFAGTRFLLARNNIDPKWVTHLEYRGRGWPGSVLIQMANGEERLIPHKDAWSIAFNYFTPVACFACSDAAGELADISVGDAWLPELRSEYGRNPGENLVIARSEFGAELLAQAQNHSIIELQTITRQAVLGSLRRPLMAKKKFHIARLQALRWLGVYCPEQPNGGIVSPRAALYSICDTGVTLLAMRPAVFKVLVHTPQAILKGITMLISLVQEDAGHLWSLYKH